MILLDTHAWLWWAADHDKLPARLRRWLAAERQLGISAMSCWEAAMLIRHGCLIAPGALSRAGVAVAR